MVQSNQSFVAACGTYLQETGRTARIVFLSDYIEDASSRLLPNDGTHTPIYMTSTYPTIVTPICWMKRDSRSDKVEQEPCIYVHPVAVSAMCGNVL